jgi:hypothetical protein
VKRRNKDLEATIRDTVRGWRPCSHRSGRAAVVRLDRSGRAGERGGRQGGALGVLGLMRWL